MTYCQAGNMQVLQEASKWCPDAEKVFVSPTGQLVDPAAAQQQVTAPHVNGASQPQTPGKALPEHTISCLSNFPTNHDSCPDHICKMPSLDNKAKVRVHHQLCCAVLLPMYWQRPPHLKVLLMMGSRLAIRHLHQCQMLCSHPSALLSSRCGCDASINNHNRCRL